MRVFLFLLVVGMFCSLVCVANNVYDLFQELEGSIDIAGGTSHIPVMKKAARTIMRSQSKIRVTVAGGGSGVGVQKVGEGLVDIGNTGRALSSYEQRTYALCSYPFAIDGVAIVLHPSNPLNNITTKQVKDIYCGKITNWNQLGGNNAPITIYGRDEASGTREVFWTKLLDKDKCVNHIHVVSSNGAMKVALRRDTNGIGYMSIGYIDDNVKAPSLDGIVPSQENAVSGKYTVVRKLYMNTREDASDLIKTFITYVTSPDMYEDIEECAYIPIRE